MAPVVVEFMCSLFHSLCLYLLVGLVAVFIALCGYVRVGLSASLFVCLFVVCLLT